MSVGKKEDETITERMEREEQDKEFHELHDSTFVSEEVEPRKIEVKRICPECQIELTESYGKLECEICGYIDGETVEERFDREKHLERKKK